MNKLIKAVIMPQWAIELRQVENQYLVSIEDESGMFYKTTFDDYGYASFIFEAKILQLQGH